MCVVCVCVCEVCMCVRCVSVVCVYMYVMCVWRAFVSGVCMCGGVCLKNKITHTYKHTA